jgi:hypothetical protein
VGVGGEVKLKIGGEDAHEGGSESHVEGFADECGIRSESAAEEAIHEQDGRASAGLLLFDEGRR